MIEISFTNLFRKLSHFRDEKLRPRMTVGLQHILSSASSGINLALTPGIDPRLMVAGGLLLCP